MSKKGGGSASQDLTDLIRMQAGIGTKLVNQTDPIRQQFIGFAENDLNRANEPVTLDTLAANPQYQAARSGIEQSFDQAGDSLRATLPAGGVLDAGLTQLEGTRALGRAQSFADIAFQEEQRRQAALNRGQATAFGGVAAAQPFLQGASSGYASQLALQQQQQQAKKSLVGDLAGSAAGYAAFA